jgi:predicted short-subunit dehydrogenase-like oxidoreductase (DUF2520 family)
MTVSIIGSGNIAHFMATRLYASGVKIHYVYSRNLVNAKALATIVKAKATDNILDTANEIIKLDAIIIATSDEASIQLANTINYGDIPCIHTSGTNTSFSLKGFSNSISCIWPIHSITKYYLPIPKSPINAGVVFHSKSKQIVESICEYCSINIIEMDDSKKSILHLCATMLNNFTNHLLTINQEILVAHNLDIQLLMPLMQNTLDKLTQSPAAENQTGPALRHDNLTINKHLQLLKGKENTIKIYKLFTKSIQKNAKN